MRQLTICLVAGSVLLTTACNNNPSNGSKPRPGSTAIGDLTVDAGDVLEMVGPTGHKNIGGDFSIRPAKTNEIRVANATTGGACLIAQVEGSAGTCTRDDQCDVRIKNGLLESKWHGYCIGPGGDVGAKRCWFKPSDRYCVKGVPAGDHKIPAVDPGEVYKWAHAEQGQREVKWMVYGCLNGPVQQPGNPPCAGGPGQAMHDAGTPKVVRP